MNLLSHLRNHGHVIISTGHPRAAVATYLLQQKKEWKKVAPHFHMAHGLCRQALLIAVQEPVKVFHVPAKLSVLRMIGDIPRYIFRCSGRPQEPHKHVHISRRLAQDIEQLRLCVCVGGHERGSIAVCGVDGLASCRARGSGVPGRSVGANRRYSVSAEHAHPASQVLS